MQFNSFVIALFYLFGTVAFSQKAFAEGGGLPDSQKNKLGFGLYFSGNLSSSAQNSSNIILDAPKTATLLGLEFFSSKEIWTIGRLYSGVRYQTYNYTQHDSNPFYPDASSKSIWIGYGFELGHFSIVPLVSLDYQSLNSYCDQNTRNNCLGNAYSLSSGYGGQINFVYDAFRIGLEYGWKNLNFSNLSNPTNSSTESLNLSGNYLAVRASFEFGTNKDTLAAPTVLALILSRFSGLK
jgi:hypothetical protein